MERLTERNIMGVAVLRIPDECDRCGELIYKLNNLGNGAPIEKLAEYEDTDLTPEQIIEIDKMYAEKCREVAELKKQIPFDIPCYIGSDVYFIPSRVNYDLNKLNGHEENNRVYHQKIERIVFTERGWYLECDEDLEYGTDHILVDKFYRETWFIQEAEAEETLKKMNKTEE